jgi:hypothetical protein
MSGHLQGAPEVIYSLFESNWVQRQVGALKLLKRQRHLVALCLSHHQ